MRWMIEFGDMFFALVWRRPDDRCRWWQVISIRTAANIARNWANSDHRRGPRLPEMIEWTVTPEELPRLREKILAVRMGRFRIEVKPPHD